MANKRPARKQATGRRLLVKQLSLVLSDSLAATAEGYLKRNDEWRIDSGSQAARDAEHIARLPQSRGDKPQMSRNQIVAVTAMRVAHLLDNTNATARLMGGPQDTGVYSVWVTARACLESASIIWWLLGDSSDSTMCRIENVLNDRLDSIAWNGAFASAIGSEEDRQRQAVRLNDVLKLGEDLGFIVSSNKDPMRRRLGDGRPRLATSVRNLPTVADGTYNLFSAYSHGEQWGLIDSMRVGGIERRDGKILARPGIDILRYAFLCRSVWQAWGDAISRVVSGTWVGPRTSGRTLTRRPDAA